MNIKVPYCLAIFSIIIKIVIFEIVLTVQYNETDYNTYNNIAKVR